MTNVTYEELGIVASQQAELFRRVREGNIHPGYARICLQNIIQRADMSVNTRTLRVTNRVKLGRLRSVEGLQNGLLSIQNKNKNIEAALWDSLPNIKNVDERLVTEGFTVSLIPCCPAQLGITDSVSFEEFFKKAQSAELRTVPFETGFQYFLDLDYQPFDKKYYHAQPMRFASTRHFCTGTFWSIPSFVRVDFSDRQVQLGAQPGNSIQPDEFWLFEPMWDLGEA